MTESSGAASPRSIISRIDQRHLHLKASQILTMLATLLTSPAHYQKFIAALPAARIYLLLLGERPTPVIATQILRMIAISLKASSSFNRKFELASGWSILKTVLPFGWCQEAQEVAFDVLFGEVVQGGERHVVTCAHIVPPLLGVLQSQLDVITGLSQHDHCYDGENIMFCPRYSILLTETLYCLLSGPAEASTHAESLLEQLIVVHSSSPTFRYIFKSQTTTQYFLDAYRSFAAALSQAVLIPQASIRLLEKLTHLGLSIALDTAVAAQQKQEVRLTLPPLLNLSRTLTGFSPLEFAQYRYWTSCNSPKQSSIPETHKNPLLTRRFSCPSDPHDDLAWPPAGSASSLVNGLFRGLSRGFMIGARRSSRQRRRGCARRSLICMYSSDGFNLSFGFMKTTLSL